jgi:hypothetical protein
MTNEHVPGLPREAAGRRGIDDPAAADRVSVVSLISL